MARRDHEFSTPALLWNIVLGLSVLGTFFVLGRQFPDWVLANASVVVAGISYSVISVGMIIFSVVIIWRNLSGQSNRRVRPVWYKWGRLAHAACAISLSVCIIMFGEERPFPGAFDPLARDYHPIHELSGPFFGFLLMVMATLSIGIYFFSFECRERRSLFRPLVAEMSPAMRRSLIFLANLLVAGTLGILMAPAFFGAVGGELEGWQSVERVLTALFVTTLFVAIMGTRTSLRAMEKAMGLQG